jgi:GT2 family glycosyltransferase
LNVTCVVPATNRPPTLDRCLRAIEQAADAPEELICVRDPAGDGPAAARNAGSARANGEVIAFVDADVVVHPDAFTRLRAAFDADPGLSAVFGAYDDDPEQPDPVSGYRNLLHHLTHLEGAGEAQTFWAGLGAVRREDLAAVGGFDAGRYPHPSVEDIELGGRLSASGRRIRLDPGIRGTHLKRWTFGDMVRVDLARRGIPWTRLVLETGRGGDSLNLGVRHRLSALAALGAAVALVARRPRAALVSLVAMVALNSRLFALVWRRRGAGQAVAAIPLHLAHSLTAVASAVAGSVAHAVARARAGRR